MTVLRFYENQYETEYSAVITSVEQENDEYLVTLDQTIFYPEGGGQPADRGWINEIPVTHVEKRDGEVIHHLAEKPDGETALCRLDREHRFDYMQQHTGQHILSAVLYRDLGYDTVAVHQGEEYTTIEIETESIEDDEVRQTEQRAMEIIAGNLPIQSVWIRDEESQGYDLRREPKVKGDVRVVSLEDYDAVACGGVHTAFTGEVWLVKHVQTEKIRGRIRLYWKIGRRAYEDYRLKNDIVTSLGERFSSQPGQLLDRIGSVVDEMTSLRRQVNTLEGRLAAQTARQISHEGRELRTASGTILLFTAELREEGKDFLKKLVEAIPARERMWAFCGTNQMQESFQWIIAVSEETGFDFNRHRKELMGPIDGKGGGRPPVWQGVGMKAEGAGEFFSLFEKILSGE